MVQEKKRDFSLYVTESSVEDSKFSVIYAPIADISYMLS